MVSALVQSLSMLKWGAWWMLCLVIGEYSTYPLSPRKHRQWAITRLIFYLAFALGIGMRFGLHSHPDSKGIYIAEYLFVVLSVRNFPATPRKSIHSVRSAVCFHCCGLHLAWAASEVPAL